MNIPNPFKKAEKKSLKPAVKDDLDDFEVVDPEKEKLGDDRDTKATQEEIDAALLQALQEFETGPVIKPKKPAVPSGSR